MQQILFYVPFTNLPVYGYGAMLFLAFVFCMILAVRLGRREGVAKEKVQDLAVWIFISGIFGARLLFYLQNQEHFTAFWQFFAIWDGGLVFYGSVFGALAGYALYWLLVLRRHGVSTWKMLDIIAPCGALGLCLGRVGCLLNGCCYGNVACVDCPSISFPLAAAPRRDMTERGHQTAAGFTMKPESRPAVARVEPGSPAALSGLSPGDLITGVILKEETREVETYNDLAGYLTNSWPRGQNDLTLIVNRAGQTLQLPPFTPWSIGLHPTQLYETISMALLVFFLLSYYPCKRRDGAVMVIFMLGYAVHRFLNEMLRTDTQPVAFGMTLSQNISIVVAVGGLILGAAVLMRPKNEPAPPLAA